MWRFYILFLLCLGSLSVMLYSRFSIAYAKDWEHKARLTGDSDMTDYNYGRKVAKDYSFFFFIEAVAVSSSVIFIYYFDVIIADGFILKIYQTGIITPIVFLLCSGIIKFCAKKIIYKYDSEEKGLSESVMLSTISIGLLFLLFDWRLMLTVLAIVLGKIVWLDGSTRELVEYIKNVFISIKDYKGSLTTFFSITYIKLLLHLVFLCLLIRVFYFVFV